MKKLIIIGAALWILSTCTGGAPTKMGQRIVNNTVNRDSDMVLIEEACDSFMFEVSRKEANLPVIDIWYDSLTNLAYRYLSRDPFDTRPTDNLLHSTKFMEIMDMGFDGLCCLEPEPTGSIAYFYGAYNYYNPK